ncbi:hypothetical protein R1sor_017815 [Riccia sorocarpa]|uniref:Uncharacterized protein n=1 Tax=Riccia sorocarpa TaxID=122646 RepID=A0ABD3I7W7_9MARC
MPRNPKVQVEWQEDEVMWVVAGEKLEEPIAVSTVELWEHFPVFLQAAEEFMKIYRSAAFFFGYKERIQLPDGLEETIKLTWAKPGETFVGYKKPE